MMNKIFLSKKKKLAICTALDSAASLETSLQVHGKNEESLY